MLAKHPSLKKALKEDFVTNFSEVEYQKYVSQLLNPGFWGGEESLIAIAHIHYVCLVVHREDYAEPWKIAPKTRWRKKEYHILHANDNHYVALTKWPLIN